MGLDQINKSIILFIAICFVTSCKSNEETLIELLENNYANLYINNEQQKRQTIIKLREYFKVNKLEEKNILQISKILNELEDGHVLIKSINPKSELSKVYYSDLHFFKGSEMISDCNNSCNPKLPLGKYQITEINNLKIDLWPEANKYEVQASTAWGRRYRSLRLLNRKGNNSSIHLKLLDAKGLSISTELNFSKDKEISEECVSKIKLKNGIYNISVNTLWCDHRLNSKISEENMLKQFSDQWNEAIRDIRDTDKIILDLRENNGGDDDELKLVANTFISNPVDLYRYQFLSSNSPGLTKWLYKFFPIARNLWDEVKIETTHFNFRPIKYLHNNKIVTLISAGCFSSCEGLAQVLKAENRTKILGTKTHGGIGGPIFHTINNSSYMINLTTCLVWQRDNSLFEGVGISPDIELSQNRFNSLDNVQESAIDYLSSSTK